jgi:methylase of polypeptide subunit release factors
MAAALASEFAEPELVLADINPAALVHARANARLAELDRVAFVESDLYARTPGEFDLVVANPPYLVDASARTYRHGGGALGGGLSERIVAEGLPRLAPGGRLVLYTGAAIVGGADPLQQSLQASVARLGWPFSYRELDPDVFGEELEMPAYQAAERIAAVGLVVQRPSA